jgi:hypothetical protein
MKWPLSKMQLMLYMDLTVKLGFIYLHSLYLSSNLLGSTAIPYSQQFIYVAFHVTCTFVTKILHSCAEHSQANLSDKILGKMFNLDQGLWTFLLSNAELTSSLSLVWIVGTCPHCFISAWWNVYCCTFGRHFFSS